MALPLSNNFNGGSDGTAITPANSGGSSGDAWSDVNTGVEYDINNLAEGSFNGYIPAPADVVARCEWTSAVITGAPSEFWGRFYMYRATTPAEQQRMTRWFGIGDVEGGRLSWHTDNKVYIINSAGAAGASSTYTLSPPNLYRFEFHTIMHASAGQMDVKTFLGHSTTEIGTTYSMTGLNFATAGLTRWGVGNCIAAAPGDCWIDAVVLNATGYPGPATSTEKQSLYVTRRRSVFR